MSPFSSKAVESNRQKQKLILDLAAARAEIERLTKERDEALAQVALAYEVAAKTCSLAATNYLGKGSDTDLGSRSRAICDVALSIRALIPADAKAALEAYGREKVREGAADAWKAAALMLESGIPAQVAAKQMRDSAAILDEVEKLK